MGRIGFAGSSCDADKYEAIRKMMPFAKAVSAKCFDFDPAGNETTLDYQRLIKIVVDDAGYHQYLGIEFEGDRMTEFSGVAACKALLERLRKPGAAWIRPAADGVALYW